MSGRGGQTRSGHSGITALLPVFLRTRGALWSAVAAAASATLIVLLHALTQGLTLSPGQQAQNYFGSFEHVVSTAATVPLGQEPPTTLVTNAAVEAGADTAGVRLYVIQLGAPDNPQAADVRYEELSLSSDELVSTTTLLSGHAPTRPGQACFSPALADLAGQQPVSFYGGALALTPTCVAVNDQDRGEVTVYAAPGTWARAGQSLTQDAAHRWNADATMNVYWTGGAAEEVGAAVTQALVSSRQGDAPDQEMGALSPPVESAAEIRALPRTFNAPTNVWVFLIPLLLVPTLTAALAAWGTARLLTRSVGTLHALGLRKRRTRLLTLVLPLVTTLAGAVAGLLIGTGVGLAARGVLARLLTQPLGPWVGLPIVIILVLAGTVLGVVLGAGLALARLNARMRADLSWMRRPRIPWPSTLVLAGTAALVLCLAVLVVTGQQTLTRQIGGVVLVGLALVLIVPLVLGVRSRRGVRSDPKSLLRTRMMVSAGGTWLIMLLFGLQAVIATGAVTMMTSGVSTFNESLTADVPHDQARLRMQGDDATLMPQLRDDVRTALGAPEPFAFWMLPMMTRQSDGAVFVVENAEDAADFLGLDALDPASRQALEQGAALRAIPTDAGAVYLLDENAPDPQAPSAVVAELPEAVVSGAEGDFAHGGNLTLSSTARKHGLDPGPVIGYVFADLTEEQMALAAQLPTQQHFSADWLVLPEAPDTFDVPGSVTAGAGVLAAVSIAIALLYGIQAGAAGRPVLAGARAMGLRAGWVRSVLAGQIAWVVLVPTIVGIVGSAVGVWAVTTLVGVPVDLHVPWDVVALLVGGTTLAFVGAVLVAVRGISTNDRF